MANILFYEAKDKTRWSMHPIHPQNVPLSIKLPTVTDNGKDTRTVLSSWELMFPNEILEHIVTCTNVKIAELRPNYSRFRDAHDTNLVEIRAVIGLLYMAGIHQQSHTRIEDLWSENGTGIEFFRVVMNIKRFRFLLRALRFDDITTREERKEVDKLAPIREVFESFNENCTNNYIPSNFITVDEMLWAFRGNCPFRQFIPSKPAKYGIKAHAAVDSKTFYTLKMEVYVGTQPRGDFRLSNKPKDIVERLVIPYSGSGRTVTCDNWYTSWELAQKLKDHNLSIVGTAQKNRRFVPPFFISTANRPKYSSIFGFHNNGILCSYINKNRNVVLLLSTNPHHRVADVKENDTKIPEVILQYNSTKGGVDQVDRMVATYSVNRVSCRWPLTIFFSLLNIGALNSYIILRLNTDEDIARRLYLKELAFELCRPFVEYRLTVQQTPWYVKSRIKDIFSIQVAGRNVPDIDTAQDLCYLCPSKKNRKSRTRCEKCNNFICKSSHTVNICVECVNVYDRN